MSYRLGALAQPGPMEVARELVGNLLAGGPSAAP